MEESDIREQKATLSSETNVAASRSIARTTVTPSVAAQDCPTCNGVPAASSTRSPSYVYAIGRIEPRFPSLSVEKEFAQATSRGETAGLTDRQGFQKILSQPQNLYLVRQLCWVLTVEGLETYI